MRDFKCWKIKYKLNDEENEVLSYSGLTEQSAISIFEKYLKPNSKVIEIKEDSPMMYKIEENIKKMSNV